MSKKKAEPSAKDIYQAIVIIDNFTDEFAPITDDIPLSLIPICNFPMIEYTLQYLAFAGIQSVYIVGSSKFDAVDDFVTKRYYESPIWSTFLKVQFVKVEKCYSLGDCLRDLDSRSIIRGDFVLVEPGAMGNVNLVQYINSHRNICKKDKNATMSLLFMPMGSICKHSKDDIVVIYNSKNQLINYQYMENGKVPHPSSLIEPTKKNSGSVFDLNLRDCRVAICSASVMTLFTDNFDYQTRDDFVKSILMTDELSKETIYFNEIKESYASAVTNWRMYQRVTKDVMGSFLEPMIPGNMKVVELDRRYVYKEGNYRNKKAQLHRTTTLTRGVMIGENSILGSETSLSNTIIGDNVKIGNNVNMEESYLFNNINVGDSCSITHSVISYGCVIEPGCIISRSTIIGSNVHLPSNTFISEQLVVSCESDKYTTCQKLGDKAFLVKLADDDTDDEDSDNEEEKPVPVTRLYNLSELEPEPTGLEDNNENSKENENKNNPPIEENVFFKEVFESLMRGYLQDLKQENLILEINSSRYAYNVTINEVTFNVVKAILALYGHVPMAAVENETHKIYFDCIKKLFAKYSLLLKNYIRTDENMVACVQALEKETETNDKMFKTFVTLLHKLYQDDLVTADAILLWHAGLEKESNLYAEMRRFVEWLQTDSDDEEGNEEEESEESSEEDDDADEVDGILEEDDVSSEEDDEIVFT